MSSAVRSNLKSRTIFRIDSAQPPTEDCDERSVVNTRSEEDVSRALQQHDESLELILSGSHQANLQTSCGEIEIQQLHQSHVRFADALVEKLFTSQLDFKGGGETYG